MPEGMRSSISPGSQDLVQAKERLSSELLLKSDLEAVVHQLEQEKQRLNKKLQSLAVTGKMLFFLAGELLCGC